MPGPEDDKVTAEVIPLTDEQLFDQQLVIAIDMAKELRGKLAGLSHVIREVGRQLDPLILRLETMQEARKG